MKKLILTHRQRQIIKSALISYHCEYQSTPIDAIHCALVKAGIKETEATIAAYEKYLVEYEEAVHRWVNQMLCAAGVMPRELWCLGVPATQRQLDYLAEALGIRQFPSAFVTDAQARAMLEILETIRPRRANKWMTRDERNRIVKTLDAVDAKAKELAAATRLKCESMEPDPCA